MTTSDRASRAQSRREKETRARIAKIKFQRVKFEKHSEGLETESVALELDDVYELDKMFICN